jgi:hypothetical protein
VRGPFSPNKARELEHPGPPATNQSKIEKKKSLKKEFDVT